MLCLSRRIGESLIVGEGPSAIEIKVYSVRGDKVKLAISGPREIRVDRREVREMRDAK